MVQNVVSISNHLFHQVWMITSKFMNKKPCAGTLPPFNHDCRHNDDHQTHGEPCCTIDDGTLRGLKDMFLAGVALVGQCAHTSSFSTDLHAAAIVAAAPPAAFRSIQVHQLYAGIEGGVQSRHFRECRDGGGRWRGAVGTRREGDASWQLLHDNTWVMIYFGIRSRIFSARFRWLTVFIRVVVAVDVPIAELLRRLAWELVQAGPAASRAALPWTAVGVIHKDMVVVTLTCPTSRGSEAQVLAVTVVFCAQIRSCRGVWRVLEDCFRRFVCLIVPFLHTSLTRLAECLETDHLSANLKPQLVFFVLILVPEPGLVCRKYQATSHSSYTDICMLRLRPYTADLKALNWNFTVKSNTVGAWAITTDSHPQQQVISQRHGSQTITNLQLPVARSIKLNSTNAA